MFRDWNNSYILGSCSSLLTAETIKSYSFYEDAPLFVFNEINNPVLMSFYQKDGFKFGENTTNNTNLKMFQQPNITPCWSLPSFSLNLSYLKLPEIKQPFKFFAFTPKSNSSLDDKNRVNNPSLKATVTSGQTLGGLKTKVHSYGDYEFITCAYTNATNLKDDMKEILGKLHLKAKELGYTMVVGDGWRSHEAQEKGYITKPGLCAKPGHSAHEYGVAFDLNLFDAKGNAVSIDTVMDFAIYAEKLGLEWGGRWKSPNEPWHFNAKGWYARADVASDYKKACAYYDRLYA